MKEGIDESIIDLRRFVLYSGYSYRSNGLIESLGFMLRKIGHDRM